MQPVDSKKINAPLSQRTLQIIDGLFRKEQEKCNKIFHQYVDEAKKSGEDFRKKLLDHETFQNYVLYLKFFKENEYLNDVGIVLKNFNNYVERSQKIIENAKLYNKLSDDCKNLYELTNKNILYENNQEIQTP